MAAPMDITSDPTARTSPTWPIFPPASAAAWILSGLMEGGVIAVFLVFCSISNTVPLLTNKVVLYGDV